MKRGAPLRRTPMHRGSRRVGQAARERVAAGGPIATGRPALDLKSYRALCARVFERAAHRCERCGSSRLRLDPEHCHRRSAGGADSEDNIWAACSTCHALKDAPFRSGRLLVSQLGAGRFCFRLVQAETKWSPRTTLAHDHSPTTAWFSARHVRRSPWEGASSARAISACLAGTS